MPIHRAVSNRNKARIQLLGCVAWLLAVGYISDKAATLAAHRSYTANAQCNGKKLPDLALDILPDWNGAEFLGRVPDIFVFFMAISVVLHGFGPRGSWVLARFCVVYGFLLGFRSLTIIATSYSAPGQNCQDTRIPWRWWGNTFMFWFPTCGDYMYSGHTSTFVLASLVHTAHLNEFAFFDARPKTLMLTLVFIWAMCIMGMMSLLLCRFHYLSDVLIAFYVTSSAFLLHCSAPHWGAPNWLVKISLAEDKFVINADFPVASLAELRRS